MSNFTVMKCPRDELAITNCAIINPNDLPNAKYVNLDNSFIFTVRRDPAVPLGSVGASMIQRRWAYLSLNQQVALQPYRPEDYNNGNCYLSTIEFEVSFLKKVVETNEVFDFQEMSSIFIQKFQDQIFTIEQVLVFEFHGINLQAKVLNLNAVDLESLLNNCTTFNPGFHNGILKDQTSITFTSASNDSLKLNNNTQL